MPTPFSHLVMLERLRQDETLPHPIQRLLTSYAPAYTLGSIAPDARVPAPDSRYATHFYTYSKPMEEAPWRAMLKAHPQLIAPTDDEQRAFVAGYAAHLAMDEIWSREMLGPQFALADWGKDLQYRFFILQDLLVFMDERDEKQISPAMLGHLQQAQAGAWLPFMTRDILADWQQSIVLQLLPGGRSLTLEVLGERAQIAPAELRRRQDDPQWMQQELWANVPVQALATVEQHMAEHARASLIAYLTLSVGNPL
ncbi:MAG: zinc dependent phospholipase C family protein [Phototrophicaceae bacterium]|jgi:hypothetical protein